jgi:hypothetical protein
VLNYIRKNVHRMDYPTYLRRGWQIGSGAVESACKMVINQRLKGYPETYLSLSCRRVKEMTQGTYQGQGSHAKIVPFRPDRRAVEPGQ